MADVLSETRRDYTAQDCIDAIRLLLEGTDDAGTFRAVVGEIIDQLAPETNGDSTAGVHAFLVAVKAQGGRFVVPE